MKKLTKFPLYLGLSVFVVSVLVSAVTIGERTRLGIIGSQAAKDGAILALRFTPEDTISVELISEKPVEGIDVTLQYNPSNIDILSSTLTGLGSYITTGGVLDETSGTFAFSVIAGDDAPTTAVVAIFHVKHAQNITVENQKTIVGQLDFVTSSLQTTVLEKTTHANILQQGKGVEFNLTNTQ